MQPRLDYGIITENQTRNRAIMRPTQFSADTISALLGNQTIASLAEVMAALGAGASRRTAFRKLKDIDARTSYSHRGGYYTLDPLADFDERGLWSFAGVREPNASPPEVKFQSARQARSPSKPVGALTCARYDGITTTS